LFLGRLDDCLLKSYRRTSSLQINTCQE
jgi:hypothetical protein